MDSDDDWKDHVEYETTRIRVGAPPRELELAVTEMAELPPGAREALARAAALRAAGGGVSSGGRGSSLRSKEGSDRVSGGSVGTILFISVIWQLDD